MRLTRYHRTSRENTPAWFQYGASRKNADMTTVEKAEAEIAEVLKKYGVQTYVIVLKDPDSDNVCTVYDGSYAWICGHAAFMVDLMQRRYNADRYERRGGE